MTRLVLLIAIVALSSSCASAQEALPFPPIDADASVFEQAIAQERLAPRDEVRVTGITVPHHLLAADLIARGFWAAAANAYDRVIIVSPDHFNRSRRPFAASRRGFATVFGPVANDVAGSAALLRQPDLFDDSDLFAAEHGIAALVPFVRRFFPAAKVIPVAIANSATRADWDRAVAALVPLIGPRVLLVQSTDYSHYRPLGEAVQRDQETLNVIAAGDLEAATALLQPAHMDSKGAQYIQMRLQGEIARSHATVIANRNSSAYSSLGVKTTSYVVTAYTATAEMGAALRYPDQDVVYLAGDTFLGRFLTAPLADPEVADAVVAQVRAVTGGAPLIVNLEGVLLDNPPEGLRNDIHVMHASLALPILKKLNVVAASLANNHSFDLGAAGYEESTAILRRAGIAPLRHKEVTDLGALRVLALNFVGKIDQRGYPVVHDDLEDICRVPARAPLLAFVHWGEEYTSTAGPAEDAAAAALAACGVSTVVGAHSHQAAGRIEARAGGEYALTFSLGNFLFDQHSPRGSGALMELRVFRQGTFAARLVPLPNLFELASAALQEKTRRALMSRGTILERSTGD